MSIFERKSAGLRPLPNTKSEFSPNGCFEAYTGRRRCRPPLQPKLQFSCLGSHSHVMHADVMHGMNLSCAVRQNATYPCTSRIRLNESCRRPPSLPSRSARTPSLPSRSARPLAFQTATLGRLACQAATLGRQACPTAALGSLAWLT